MRTTPLRIVGTALLSVLGLLLACELLLRALPVSSSTETGYFLDPAILNYPPGHRWTMSTGWDLRNAHRMVANDIGFAADHDAVVGPRAVPLIGDSFVEASMLDAPDRPAAQLEAALQRPVDAMGGPGSALLDYAERIRWAAAHLGARDMVVVMERYDVRQSLCGSGNVHAACLDRATLAPRTETLPPAGPAKRLLRHLALAQYVVSQLKLDPASLGWRAAAQARPATAAVPAATAAPAPAVLRPDEAHLIDTVTDRFFERIRGLPAGRLVIVLDSDRERLQQHLPVDDPGRRRFIERARGHGAVVVDTQPLFEAHFARSDLSLIVGPYDRHLNPLAVRIAMQAAADAMR